MTFTASNLRTAFCPLSNIFYGKQTGCWVEKEKKKEKKENVKSLPVIFARNFGIIKNLANFLFDVRREKISFAIFHYPLVKNCDTLDGYNACTRSDIQID